jgi:hypothetical protein
VFHFEKVHVGSVELSFDGEQELRAKNFIVWTLSLVPLGPIVLLVVLATEKLNRTWFHD